MFETFINDYIKHQHSVGRTEKHSPMETLVKYCKDLKQVLQFICLKSENETPLISEVYYLLGNYRRQLEKSSRKLKKKSAGMMLPSFANETIPIISGILEYLSKEFYSYSKRSESQPSFAKCIDFKEHLLMLFFTTMPPSRVGLTRTLRFGATLKIINSYYNIDITDVTDEEISLMLSGNPVLDHKSQGSSCGIIYPVSKIANDAMHNYKCLLGGVEDQDYIFSNDGDAPWSDDTFRDKFKKIWKKYVPQNSKHQTSVPKDQRKVWSTWYNAIDDDESSEKKALKKAASDILLHSVDTDNNVYNQEKCNPQIAMAKVVKLTDKYVAKMIQDYRAKKNPCQASCSSEVPIFTLKEKEQKISDKNLSERIVGQLIVQSKRSWRRAATDKFPPGYLYLIEDVILPSTLRVSSYEHNSGTKEFSKKVDSIFEYDCSNTHNGDWHLVKNVKVFDDDWASVEWDFTTFLKSATELQEQVDLASPNQVGGDSNTYTTSGGATYTFKTERRVCGNRKRTYYQVSAGGDEHNFREKKKMFKFLDQFIL